MYLSHKISIDLRYERFKKKKGNEKVCKKLCFGWSLQNKDKNIFSIFFKC